jgi:hypothetical protein
MGSDVEPEHVTHRRLLDAVESDDPDRAASAVRDHIIQAGRQLLSKLDVETGAHLNGTAHPNGHDEPSTRRSPRRRDPGGKNTERS